MTFHYLQGVTLGSRRGQLLGNQAIFNHFSLLPGGTLGSLPSGTAAE